MPANAQQAAVTPRRNRNFIKLWPARGAKKNRIRRQQVGHGLVRDDRTLGMVGSRAIAFMAERDVQAAMFAEPFHDAHGFHRHFRSDAIARQDDHLERQAQTPPD